MFYILSEVKIQVAILTGFSGEKLSNVVYDWISYDIKKNIFTT